MKTISRSKVRDLVRSGKTDPKALKRKVKKLADTPKKPEPVKQDKVLEVVKSGTRSTEKILKTVTSVADLNCQLMDKILESLEAVKPIEQEPACPVLKWEFSIERDHRGLIQTVTAKGTT